MLHITVDQFKNRFVALVMASGGLPKKPQDRQIVYLSSILKLVPDRLYSESELNDQLQHWTARFGANFGLDHVTLRRYLIDERFIQRDSAGTAYQLAKTELTYDPIIADLDLANLIAQAKIEKEQRKQQFMHSAKR